MYVYLFQKVIFNHMYSILLIIFASGYEIIISKINFNFQFFEQIKKVYLDNLDVCVINISFQCI